MMAWGALSYGAAGPRPVSSDEHVCGCVEFQIPFYSPSLLGLLSERRIHYSHRRRRRRRHLPRYVFFHQSRNQFQILQALIRTRARATNCISTFKAPYGLSHTATLAV